MLYTNDIHGRIQQLARIASIAKKIRHDVEKQNRHCVLVDAGDVEDQTLFESSITNGSAVMALMRAAQYDLVTLGKPSAVRYGPQVIPYLVKRLGQPRLAANMFDLAQIN